ncbi:MAG: hypothetical protein U5N55_03995 [Cypionkella sp.]|nr:hypothetical protein [Cypionkella sp.]
MTPFPAKTAAPNGFIRALYAVPLIGAMMRDVGRDVNIVFYYLVILATLVVLAMQVWGLAALAMTALAMVPVMFALIIWISLP